MRSYLSRKPVRRAAFWGMLLLALLPLMVFPYVSMNYHELNDMPSVENGEIDLAGYDFSARPEIPLDGKWEFYYDRWLISEQSGGADPDIMAQVPLPWTSYHMGGRMLTVKGKGSYRAVLKNCPGGIPLMVYIPNISARYRVYMNGRQVASRGKMDHNTPDPGNNNNYRLELSGVTVLQGSDCEVVIELQSPHVGGLYLTPVLGEQGKIHTDRDMRNMIASACTGVLLLSVCCIICFMFFRDKLLYSAALVTMDICVCLRFLAEDEFFEVVRNVIPVHHYYMINSVLRVTVFFLPIILLFCVNQLIHIRLQKRIILITGIYELLLSPILLWYVLNGRVRRVFFICLVGYLPFILIGRLLYREVLKKTPYSLMVSSVFLFTIGSVMCAAMGDSGMLVMSISLFPPVCFVIAMIVQLALYIWRSFELQMQAAEAENLRLRLKDSETSLMLSQIQPHFLYNTLLAIHMLCLEEPETAAETTMKFATFLRTNMKFIRDLNPIPFEKELEHIRNFADIEQIRFKSRLNMYYDIKTTDFLVPALTVQPLVENAICHGATKNVNGGYVMLRTLETEGAICIEIVDNGPGFDVKILESSDGNSFGIANVVFRLREQIHAQIQFESVLEKGTTVRITIPKGDAKDEGNSH